MRISILLVLLAVATTVFGDVNGRNWIGFKQETDPAVPTPIAQASQSIFQIIYANGVPDIRDVSNIDIQTMPSDDSNWFNVVQVRMCQLQNIQNCPIMPTLFTGTAFQVKNKNTIATNLHNIQGWMHHVKKHNPDINLEQVQPPILLADKEQNIVFNPMDGESTLKLSFYNPSPATFGYEYPWNGGDKTVFFRVSDYVELTANKPFQTNPLEFGTIADRSEPLYTSGFPNPTNVFAQFGAIDSPGHDRWVSMGPLSPRTRLENINIVANIASAPGSSGSPLLTADGKVVGILFAGASEIINGELSTETQFLQTNFDLLRTVWSQFDDEGNIR